MRSAAAVTPQSNEHLVRHAWLALAFVLAASSVEAQLMGRIRKAVEQKVTGTEPARQSGAARVALTPQRIDAFVLAMQPAKAYALEVQAARESQVRYERRQKEWEACKERVVRAANGVAQTLSVSQQMEMGELATKSVALMQSYTTHASAGRYAAASAALDSADRIGVRGFTMQFPAMSTCGVPAPRPVEAPKPPAASQAATIPPNPGGMTGQEFGRVREIIAVYLITNGSDKSLTSDDIAVLGPRQQELAQFTELFRSGALEWAQWGNLGSAWNAK
ncbi:MAG: hypothetical protein V4813_16055 [Gemmatimonadota bacterium]